MFPAVFLYLFLSISAIAATEPSQSVYQYTGILKFSIQRPYPNRYSPTNHSPPEPADFQSFPSGHTSTVASALTATAMTVSLRYGENHKWASWTSWGIAALFTGLVGFELVNAGEHFTTDVFGGALLGSTIGIAVPYLHKIKGPVAGTHLSALPVRQGAGLALVGEF